MAKLIWRLPSKAITYGYVEVHADPEELGFEHGVTDAEAIGTVYATYVGAFLKGEKEGLDLFMRGAEEKPAESRTEPRTDEQLMKDEAPSTPEGAVAIVQKELGATVVGEEPAPWSKPQAEAEPKPWEKKKAGKKPAVDVANTDW